MWPMGPLILLGLKGQADCILLVALYDQDTAVTDIEMLMNKSSSSASKELVLLHGDRNFVRGNTSAFLKDRPWLITHHHVEIPIEVHRTAKKNALDDLSRNLRPLFNKFQRFTEFYLKGRKPITRKHRGSRSDFAKLARRLMGESVGLVLGGGGARGLAHIGIIQAFEEADIPIDLVGGCSIGSFIGGLYALNEDIWYVYWRAKEFSQRMDSKWRQILDLTYPLTAWFTGHEFNRGLWKSFGDARIEDCWLNYFNVTTNISMSRLEVHMSGYLWRYIRASMTLSGYLPPICDNGHMLLDGGYLNNLPGDIIRALGADTVIAVDVGGEFDKVVADYGDYLSGWFALFQSFLSRFSLKHKFVPTLAEVQSRLAYVSSVKQLEDIKNMRGCRYLKPPVGNFGLLDFGRFEEIYNVGYNYGKEIIKEWESTGLIQTKQVSKKQVLKHHARRSSI
jgi:lysophospholipid hydrolase